MSDATGAFVDRHPSSNAASVAPSAVPIFRARHHCRECHPLSGHDVYRNRMHFVHEKFADRGGGPRLAVLSTSHYVGTTRPGSVPISFYGPMKAFTVLLCRTDVRFDESMDPWLFEEWMQLDDHLRRAISARDAGQFTPTPRRRVARPTIPDRRNADGRTPGQASRRSIAAWSGRLKPRY